MRSSPFLSVVALAGLVAGCGDPEIVVGITNNSGGTVDVYACHTGTLGVTGCKNTRLAKTPESVGIDVSSETALTAKFEVNAATDFCMQLDIDLSHGTPVQIDLTVDGAVSTTSTCQPLGACTELVACQ